MRGPSLGGLVTLMVEDDLGRMRVLAGRLGCPPGIWSHLPHDVERGRLVEFCHSVLDELPKRGMALEDYLALRDEVEGVKDNVVRLPMR